jgi:hypothetical protein
LAGEIAQDTHDERQFLDLNGVANFHVVRYLNSRRTYTIEFVLRAIFCHNAYPQVPKDGDGTFIRRVNAIRVPEKNECDQSSYGRLAQGLYRQKLLGLIQKAD